MSWPQGSFRTMYPRIAVQIERKAKDIYWALDRCDENMIKNYIEPEFREICKIFRALQARMRRERGDIITMTELGMLDLGWSIRHVETILDGNQPIQGSVTDLKWRCWRIITDVTDQRGLWVIVSKFFPFFFSFTER